MKKILSSLAALIIVLSPVFAQGRVTTRKYKLADFRDKILKVVLTGSDLLDGALRQEVVATWTISPFEFCNMGEFSSLKKSADYYFLLPAQSEGLLFLTLVKGAPEAGEGTAGMHEVVSLPLSSAGISSGRELVYLGAFIESIQSFVVQAMDSEHAAYKRDDWFNRNYSKNGKMMSIWLSEDDLAGGLYEKLTSTLDEDFHIVAEDEVDNLFETGAYNTLCSYVVTTQDMANGDVCYTMLFDAGSRMLYYIHKHKVSVKKGVGFVSNDFSRIKKGR